MKRILAIILSALMLLGSMGALAESESELGRVTLLVKERLGIGDDYSEFYGDSYADAAGNVYWNLNWFGDAGSVYVTCDREGTVYEYNRYDSDGDSEPWSNDFAPRLAEETEEQYRPAVEAFLEANVPEGFGWSLESGHAGTRNYRLAEFHFDGSLTRGGYDTGVRLNATVRVRDKVVTSFWRSDAYTAYSSFDIPEKLIDAAEARALLEAGLNMELRYVRDEPGKAVLRYLPKQEGGAYVNAATGERMDADEGDYGVYAEGSTADDAGGMALNTVSRASLTEVEISGIQAAEGLLSREELDARARAIGEFGLTDKYVLSRFHIGRDGDQAPFATLRYLCEVDEEALAKVYGVDADSLAYARVNQEAFCIEKTVCLDAETGALISLNTYYPFGGGVFTYAERSEDEVRAVAEGFLERHAPERFARTACTGNDFSAPRNWYDPQWRFDFTRAESGVRFDDNALYVGVNVDTGCVDEFHCAWDDELEFESAEDVIGAEKAKEIWLVQFETALRFIDVVDEYRDYAAIYKGVLCYALRGDVGLGGVNAVDGSIFSYAGETAGYVYTDLEGCPEREAIETLAAHGIGFLDDAFRPDEAIALRDWLLLLLKAGEYSWVDTLEDGDLARWARDLGIPLPDGDLSATLTRADAARMLIGMSGYGKAAMLREAFACGFADADELEEGEYGYIAIAGAMGVVRADAEGRFRPHEPATRAEAAAMLLRFLTRAV